MIATLDALSAPLSGTRLIEASAGTGKTYTITTLYLRLLLEEGLEVPQILVVTYTKAATAELRDRVRGRIRELLHVVEALLEDDGGASVGDDPSDLERLALGRRASGQLGDDRQRLVRALSAFDEAAIFTIHGFAQRILQENAFESHVAFDTEFVADQQPLLGDLATDYWTNALFGAEPEVVAYLGSSTRGAVKLSPGVLSRLAARVTAQPAMEVLPALREVDLTAELATWRRALEEVRDRWANERDPVVALLMENRSGLNKRYYAEAKVEDEYPAQLDAFLLAPEPGIERQYRGLKYFAAAGVHRHTKKGFEPPEHPFFDACQTLFDADAALCAKLDAWVVQLERRLVEHARSELARLKDERHTQSFDDLLLRLSAALEGPGAARLAARIREQFSAALIDEFQDTDPLQYHVFRSVWHEGGLPLFLIGDPKQAIYGFRGADVFAYMEAKRDAGERASTLTTNWRSDPSVVRAINAVFAGQREPFLFEEIPFVAAEPRPEARDRLEGAPAGALRVLFVRGEGGPRKKQWADQEIVPAVADDIARLLGSGARIDGREVKAGDVAVLCGTNQQATRMRSALQDRNILGVLQGDASVFDSVDAAELERVLRAVAEPSSLRALRSALCTALLGASGAALAALREPEADWETWQTRFHAWHRLWAREGTVALVQRLFAEHGVQNRLLARPDGERRLTNLLHLSELLQAHGRQTEGGPSATVSWLARMRTDEGARAEVESEAAQLRLESDALAVQLVTVHKSKGLEYPIVYCPFAWSGRLLLPLDEAWVGYHEEGESRARKLDIGGDERDAHLALARHEMLAEKLRLLYVALTRARHQVVLVWGAMRGGESSALAYLLHTRLEGPPEPGALLDLMSEQVKMGDDAALRAQLAELELRAGGDVVVDDLPSPSKVMGPESKRPARRLAHRELGRRIEREYRTSSFSALVKGASPGGSPAFALPDSAVLVGRDVDSEPDLGSAGADEPAAGEAGVRLRDFPSGARPGTMVHEVFEHLDFERALREPAHLDELVTAGLAQHGLAARWAPTLAAAIREVLETPMGGEIGDFELARLGRADRLDELEFIFPVAARSAVPGALTPARLADTFRRHATDPRTRDYADRLADLDFAPLRGFLRGYIDLCFRRGDRHYVVDYKSNHLGTAVSDYAPARLDAPMAEHHYILQYHLYLVAVHRHLAARLPGYDYDRHMGGSYYLFLRGMAPGYPAGTGIYHDHPPRALIEGLSELIGGAS